MMTSGASSLDISGSGPPSVGYSNNDRVLPSTTRDHDGAKQQYEKTMKEMQLLRRQNSDMSRRNEHLSKDLEYYKNQNIALSRQLGAQEKLGNEANNSDSINQHYSKLSRMYESLKDEYDSLRKRYDDILGSHSAAVNKLKLTEEDLARTTNSYKNMAQEMNAITKERNALKQQCAQQCTAAIREWDIILMERNLARDALTKLQQQRDDEMNQAMDIRMKASKDIKRLTDERNAAEEEYRLIMSERDNVHKELEKLNDDLAQETNKNKILQTQIKDYADEKKILLYQVETLKREIQSALHDRDKVLKECNDLREKFGEYTAKEESNQGFKSRMESNSYSRERDNLRKDQAEVSSSTRDMYGKSQRERLDNLDQANLELDSLRKQSEKLQVELQEAIQEAEVSKSRRDWAFVERDKIVLERESIRTLCDRLRKERDRAVSDLAEALRDSDDIKKQRNEASKELKELKEKVEAQLEKENRMQQLHAGHNHSHDSAIDTDMQEWDIEILEIDLAGLTSDDDLGFDLVGGRDDPHYPNGSGIYVSSITKGSITDGKLRVNDCISRVNNLDCSNVSKRIVMEKVRSSGGTASMVVRRRRVGSRCLYTTQLQLHLNCEHGLTLETGIYISKISPGSLAAKEGNLAVGDRILSINNKTMDGLKSAREAMSMLTESGDLITITTLKSTSNGQNGSIEDDRNFGSRIPSSSLKEHPDTRHYRMVDSSSQTEERNFASSLTEDYIDRRYLISSFEQSSKSKSNIREKSSGQRTWNTIREKFHNVRGPKTLKREEKKHARNISPTANSFEREQDDAIAELDSVIDTYHPKQNKRKEKGVEQNGGTWPKVRGGPIIHQGTGTIVHPRKTKQRLPLADLLNNKYQTEFPRRMNRNIDAPRPVSDFVQFAKSGQLLHTRNSFSPTSFKEPSMEFERDHDRDTLSVLAPSDGSIDLSVKSGNTGKDVIEYYVYKRANKYAVSDSESNMSPVESSLSPHVRGHSQLYPSLGLRSLPYPYPVHPHTHAPTRYYSPTHIPFTHSGDSIGNYSGFGPSYTPPQQSFHHTHSPSVDVHYAKSLSLPLGHSHPPYRVDDIMPPVVSPPSHGHELGTYPRKKENQRIRIPSNPSVTNTGKVSTGSIERTSERGSPMSTYYTFEVVSPGRENKRNSLQDYCCNHKAQLGEVGRVHIDKSVEPLGIQISSPEDRGVFVSSVTEDSIASKAGLLVGHQLLEVCGINLRCANYTLAASVLQQCGNSITMLVQYNPDKYHEAEASPSTSGDESHSRSGSPTPCNSPKINRKSTGDSTNLRGTYAQSTLTRSQISPGVSTLSRQNPTMWNSTDTSKLIHDPRYLYIETKKCSNLGISLVGGNAVGIFVHSVQMDSSAYNAGLRPGDQILEYSGTDLRQATAEEAAYELAKPADKVTVLALYNINRYNEVKDKPGDSFYIKALFDRTENCSDSLQLRFHKDDILFVDNTMFNGVPGHWWAWLVDEDGHKKQGGIIPSKYKVEEELLRRSMGDLEADSRRGTRRSFFRRKKHQRSSSRDSKELASFTSTINSYSDSGTLNEETTLSSYQRVERFDYPTFRPVIIIGPLSDSVTEKLFQDFPDKFTRCVPQIMQGPQNIIEKGIIERKFIDFKKKGNYFECTTVAAIKDICDKNSHCILDVSLQSVERLHKHQIYPIVLLIKFKSTKQIKEVKDARYTTDKLSAKAAKEMYEHTLKLESEYRHHISAVIQVTGVNVAYMCTQIKGAVDHEQSKTLWVPCSSM